MKVVFQRTHPAARIPTRGSAEAAGYDLYAPVSVIIPPRSATSVNLGLKMAVPKGTVALIYSRSGMGFKHDIRLANAVGVIDSDFRGELAVRLTNDGDFSYEVHRGDRIAQIVLQPYLMIEAVEEEVDTTERGVRGFGSTGV